MTTKIGFLPNGTIEVRDAPNPKMPNYQVQYGVVALTPEQASTAVLIFGWARRGEAGRGLVEVGRTEAEYREACRRAIIDV